MDENVNGAAPADRSGTMATLNPRLANSPSSRAPDGAVDAVKEAGWQGVGAQEPSDNRIDMPADPAQIMPVKRRKSHRERKSKGTLIVQEHRPMMNRLTDAERQRLMKAGYELIYAGQRQ